MTISAKHYVTYVRIKIDKMSTSPFSSEEGLVMYIDVIARLLVEIFNGLHISFQGLVDDFLQFEGSCLYFTTLFGLV